jgi:hypothetical protein
VIVSVYQKELGYAPCRDERCNLDYVHPEHTVAPRPVGRTPRTCPNCFTKVIAQACPACSWRRPKKALPSPAPRREMTVEQLLRFTMVIRQVAEIGLTEYRCPTHSRGGCGGRGWRKSPAKPCRVCSGLGSVRWTSDQMVNFLSTARR